MLVLTGDCVSFSGHVLCTSTTCCTWGYPFLPNRTAHQRLCVNGPGSSVNLQQWWVQEYRPWNHLHNLGKSAPGSFSLAQSSTEHTVLNWKREYDRITIQNINQRQGSYKTMENWISTTRTAQGAPSPHRPLSLCRAPRTPNRRRTSGICCLA